MTILPSLSGLMPLIFLFFFIKSLAPVEDWRHAINNQKDRWGLQRPAPKALQECPSKGLGNEVTKLEK